MSDIHLSWLIIGRVDGRTLEESREDIPPQSSEVGNIIRAQKMFLDTILDSLNTVLSTIYSTKSTLQNRRRTISGIMQDAWLQAACILMHLRSLERLYPTLHKHMHICMIGRSSRSCLHPSSVRSDSDSDSDLDFDADSGFELAFVLMKAKPKKPTAHTYDGTSTRTAAQ